MNIHFIPNSDSQNIDELILQEKYKIKNEDFIQYLFDEVIKNNKNNWNWNEKEEISYIVYPQNELLNLITEDLVKEFKKIYYFSDLEYIEEIKNLPDGMWLYNVFIYEETDEIEKWLNAFQIVSNNSFLVEYQSNNSFWQNTFATPDNGGDEDFSGIALMDNNLPYYLVDKLTVCGNRCYYGAIIRKDKRIQYFITFTTWHS